MTISGKQFSYGDEINLGFMGLLEGYDHRYRIEKEVILDPIIMAEQQEESRTESTTVNEAGSSSKDDQRDNNNNNDISNWLQLGIGSSNTTITTTNTSHDDHEMIHKQDEDQISTRGTRLLELNLLPRGNSRDQIFRPSIDSIPEFDFRRPSPMPVSTNNIMMRPHDYFSSNNISTSLFLQQGVGSSSSSSFLFPQHHQDINWAAYRAVPRNLMFVPTNNSSGSSSSSSFLPQRSYNLGRSFEPQLSRGGGGVNVAAGPSFDLRIIDPPRRPHCGIWFMLQASQNQEKALILPQVPKSYLRIKDGMMTVRLLMKYLVNKLRLDNESEIEVTCRGEKLQPFLTLQHVRDTLWNTPRNDVTFSQIPHSSSSITTDHIMVLNYSRSKLNN